MAAGSGAILGASIAAPVIGGIIGADQANKDRASAENARAQALAQYLGISVPEAADMMINLQQYQSAGTLDPVLEQLITQGDTSMAGISTDPRLRQQQMAALDQYTQLAQSGATPADMAGFELARQNAAAEMQAKNNQILQEMQQRGQGGSGAELLAKLKGSQSGTQLLQQAQLEQAQAMQQARMAALAQQANLGSSIRQQDYGEQADLARARDAIANFNAQNSQAVQSRNVGSQNTAQAGNLANRQNIANLNTETMNKQQIHNQGLKQQQFQNQMQLADAKAGQYGNAAAAAQQQAGQTAGMWAGIGQGVGTGLAAFANKPSGNVQVPNNVGGTSSMVPFDPSKFGIG